MNLIRLGLLVIGLGLVALFPYECVPQVPFIGLDRARLKGKIKSLRLEREYLIAGGKQSNLAVKIIDDEYNKKGELIRTIEYGNGEKHTQYIRNHNKTISAKVHYFASDGQPMSSNLFVGGTNTPTESDLCNDYAVHRADDQDGKIEREYETCRNGSLRATIIREFGLNNELIRDVRTDANNRKWESSFDYDQDGNVTEYRYTVNDQKRPEYIQRMNYGDYKFDKRGNWTQVTVVSQISTFPGRIAYQFKEKAAILYWD